jgi:hypothetical protein
LAREAEVQVARVGSIELEERACRRAQAVGPFAAAGRGLLHALVEPLQRFAEQRAITKNRQPGRCCDTGCTVPGQAVMVPLPASRKAG